MEKEKLIWIYQGKEYPDRKQLKKENNLSTSRFNAKIRDKEIITQIQCAQPYENNQINL